MLIFGGDFGEKVQLIPVVGLNKRNWLNSMAEFMKTEKENHFYMQNEQRPQVVWTEQL